MKTFLLNHKMSFLLPSFSFLFLFSCLLNTFVSSTQHLCHSDQSEALLEFKTEFVIKNLTWKNISSYPKTESWKNNNDCCSWDGITCDANSGKVIGLDLSASCLHGRLESNSSLFRLLHLRDLNLAYNNFTHSSIPAEFNQLKELERLNLSCSSFSGRIPTALLQLTKLVSLDLSSSWDPQLSLSIDESFLPLLVRNLRNLRELDMSSVNISSEIPHELSSMWSLRVIRLVNCNLLGEFPNGVFLIPKLKSIILDFNQNLRGSLPVFHGNNSIKILSLSETSFSGTIPDSISNLKHLTSLDLGFSLFSGKISSSLGNLSSLSYLSLSVNDFFGEIPSSIGNLKHLSYFSVRSNKFSGDIPSTLLNLTQLRSIDLGFNQFTGLLPPNISHLPLESFDVRGNSFTGVIPSSLFMIPSLKRIYLENNLFSDLAGIENISQLLDLQQLDLGKNKFMGSPIDLNIFSPLRKLEYLFLSGLPLTTSNNLAFSSEQLLELDLSGCNLFEFPEFIRNQRNLIRLVLSNNKIKGLPLTTSNNLAFSSEQLFELDLSGCNLIEFPEFIRNQRNLIRLVLSNNKIKGQVPYWLWRLPDLWSVDLSNNAFNGFKGSLMALPDSKISFLDLSSNAFQGTLLIPSRFTEYFSLSKNNFTGEIPRSICRLASPIMLDLSENNLNGSIPWCLKNQMSSLEDLNLHNNNFSGSLPDIFINAKSLKSLDVSHNQLEGKLPPSLNGCSALEVLNVGSNKINGMFPFKLNSLEKLKVLVLRSNKFHGTILNAERGWFGFPELNIIDVSDNDFIGTLPNDYFLNWTAISSTRDNSTKPEYISGRGYYYTLDLNIKGVSLEMERILVTYTAIDFSGNKLQGRIPDSIGLLKGLRILNLSRNAFTDHIPSSLVNLKVLESLDISQNNISGQIPPELGTLSSLAWINVSHNQLEGPIPQGTQFRGQNCSSYEGNPGLSLQVFCGDNLTKSHQFEGPILSEEEEEELISWKAAGLGFVPGVVFGLAIGYKFMKTFGRNKK